MKPEDAEEYTQALGQVVAGGWRQVALGKRLGVPQALNLSVEDWVQQRLGGYIKLAIPERREAVIELVAEGLPNTEIASVLGVTEKTIRRDRDLDSANAEPEPESPSVEDEDSANAEPPTAEQWAYLEEVQQRARELKERQAEHPDEFATDDIFEVLDYAVEVVDTWIDKVGLAAKPGTKSPTEWQGLIDRLQVVTDYVRRLHENDQTYEGQQVDSRGANQGTAISR